MTPRFLPVLLLPAALGFTAVSAAMPDDTIPVGVVYNIFHEEFATDADFFHEVDRDLPAIAAAHFDHVMIFPMSEWDPATRTLRWVRTDYLVRKLEELHLKFVPLMLKEEQCSYYFPIWRFREFGLWDARDVNNGNPNNRENVDFADPKIFPLVIDYFKAVVARYGHSPALSFYNVWNEPHYSSTAPHVIARFRTWLQKKYGTLAALRRVWGDDYTDWSEVTPFLNDDWNSSMPGIDWTLFRMELQGSLLGELTTELRKLDPVHPVNANPVGTPFANFGAFSGYNTDAWQFTPFEDFAGASYYPDAWAKEQGLTRAPLWFHNLSFDVFRCAAGDREYILTELYTNAKTGLSLDGYLDADTARQVAWTALANDCKGLIYWKWQPFRRGRQSLGRGLVGLDGQLAPRGEAVRDFAAVIQQHNRLLRAARLAPAEVGVIVDLTGLLKTQLQTAEPRTQTFMYQSIAGVFRALDEANLTVDLLRADLGLDLARLQRYKVLFLPFQIVVRRDLAPLLRSYVEAGGCLVADARTATVDELDFAYTPSPGAGLDDLFGADRRDWVGTPGTHRVRLADGAPAAGEFDGKYFREQLRPRPGTVVLGTFPDTGEPALVASRTGRGTAVLSAVPLGASYFDRPANPVNRLLLGLCARASVTPPATFVSARGAVPMIRVHQLGAERVVYVLNPGEQSLEGELSLPAPGTACRATELLSGESITCRRDGSVLHIPVRLAASGVQVFHVTP